MVPALPLLPTLGLLVRRQVGFLEQFYARVSRSHRLWREVVGGGAAVPACTAPPLPLPFSVQAQEEGVAVLGVGVASLAPWAL